MNSTEELNEDVVKYRVCPSKSLVVLVIIFAAVSVALAVAFAVTFVKLTESSDGPKSGGGSPINSTGDVCLTPGCVMAAARVMGAMDETKDPCNDFYNFACGTWLKENVIPEDKSSYGTFTKLRDDVTVIMKSVLEAPSSSADPEAVNKSRNYYSACKKEEKIEELGLTFIHTYMEGFGGWPVLGNKSGGKWDPKSYNLEQLLIHSRKGSNSLPIVDFGVTKDEKQPTKYILYIDQPGLGMPSRDYYLKGRDDKTLMAYQTMLEESMVGFGADGADAKTAAKDIVDFEIDLANITVPKEERRDPEKLYNKMTIGDLRVNFTGFDFKVLIESMMAFVGETVTDTEEIIAVAPPYLSEFGDVLKKYSNKTLANYVVAQRVIGKWFYLPKVFTDIQLRYKKVLTGSAAQPARWQDCANTVKNTMPEVVGRLFVEEAFKKAAKEDVKKLVEKLRFAFKDMIGDLPWMEDKTKNIAKEKADAIEARIGYSDVVYNNTALNKKYENVTVYPDDPLKTSVSVGESAVIRQLQLLRMDVDKTEWDMSPATVNAYYNPETNQITFPAAILQPPFYSHDQPAYLNYGGIGYVIGHEITHGFDDQGRLYDKKGNLHNWWSDVDAAKFKVKAQCIIDQYGNFTVPGTGGMKLNGINTQGENIADNGGVKESFKAYRKWVDDKGKEEDKLPGIRYSQNQLYFINAAQIWCEEMRDKAKVEKILTDPHSISMFRVYGPLQNFEEFSNAWNCPKGSYMNPEHKCSVW